MSHLLGVGYTVNQMSYDLTRLHSNDLIERLPHTNTYLLSRRATRRDLCTKVHDRLLRPLLAGDQPPH